MVNFFSKVVRRHRPFRIVIVCTANRARSPYAVSRLESLLLDEWFFNGNSPRKDTIPFQILGAGIHTMKGSTPLPEINRVAWERALDIRGFVAVPFNIKMERQADLILTMENRHTERVMERFPRTRGRVFRLTDFKRNGDPNPLGDIPDPTIGSDRTFREIADIIDLEIVRVFPHLMKIVGL